MPNPFTVNDFLMILLPLVVIVIFYITFGVIPERRFKNKSQTNIKTK
jgi:hypothetical protein